MAHVAVIDYGMGNLRSVVQALMHVAGPQKILLTDDPAVVADADRVVFPGQGAARDCMRALSARGMEAAVRAALFEKPFLGICMGLQVLLDTSAENEGTQCLGLVGGEVRRFAPTGEAGGTRLKVPHMGWNQVQPAHAHPLWDGIAPNSRFYFVHSYYVVPQRADVIAAYTDYGVRFASAAAQGTVFATQFHPEKSQQAGLRLLANFLRWDGSGDGSV